MVKEGALPAYSCRVLGFSLDLSLFCLVCMFSVHVVLSPWTLVPSHVRHLEWARIAGILLFYFKLFSTVALSIYIQKILYTLYAEVTLCVHNSWTKKTDYSRDYVCNLDKYRNNLILWLVLYVDNEMFYMNPRRAFDYIYMTSFFNCHYLFRYLYFYLFIHLLKLLWCKCWLHNVISSK